MGNYSDWFKVDLHIHTDFSNKTKINDYDGEFDLLKLKDKLLENEVKLFSLTDHNIINTAAYKSYYESEQENDPSLLVGCEFDIKVDQNDGSFLTYHTLLIFNENTFEKAEEISVSINNHFIDKSVKDKDRFLTLDEIFDLFGKYNFFFIPHAGGHKNIIDAHKNIDITKAQEMVLLMESAHEKVKEKFKQKHHDEFDKLKDPDFRKRNEEAFINFSDNHNYKIYPTPKSGTAHEFYYLKGEPSFETLRVSFIDPQSRIKSHSELQDIKSVINYVSDINISGVENVNDCTLNFSPNLNVIIGGASSGKSLLFNLIGKKIDSKKHDFDKYGKSYAEVTIKDSLSFNYKPILSFDNNEVIYINQGDIVKYFEKGDLKELVRESGHDEEYSETIKLFSLKKNEFIIQLENFKSSFEQFNNSNQNNFILRSGDINNIQSDNFVFTPIYDIEKSIDFFSKSTLVDKLNQDIKAFEIDAAFEFTKEEIIILENFKVLLESKNKLINNKISLQSIIIIFFKEVTNLINIKNDSLESNSRAKSQSLKTRNDLFSNCEDLFKHACKFNAECKKLENYIYEFTERISINENVSLLLAAEKDVVVKKCILKCINDSLDNKSIYENYLFLLNDNSKLKDYASYSEIQLFQKLKKECCDIIQKFDYPSEILDYGINGNSKNKSPGFNAEMYLKTILQQQNCKLVMIDQPEDNLGNTFKNEDLINLLRAYKFKKQIILVSHNPSIVVYGDAECIILAKNEQGIINYEQMVLENKNYQKLIIDNLDGGKAIFDMRSRKYNIKKLLNS